MNSAHRDPLGGIRYIALDPAMPRAIGQFQVRTDVPLPVEIDADPERLESSGLSWESIISAMLKILAYDPGHRDAQYFRDFVLAVRPDIDAELTQAAVAKSRSSGFEVAVEAFRALEGLFPDNARHSVNLALVYEERAEHQRQLGHEAAADADLEGAFQCYRRALAVGPELADTHLYLANFHLRQQSFGKAHAELKEYLARDPADKAKRDEAIAIVKEIEARNLVDEQFRSAYDFIRMGQEEKGIARITQFLEANPGIWNGWFLLGWAHRRLRRYGEARDAFVRALELGGKNIDILNELAICSMELGDLASTRNYLEQALRIDTENVKVLSNLGVLSLREGKPDDARACFQLVLDIDPEDPVATASLARLSGRDPSAEPHSTTS
jgi:tetratricopeptide (TPR) repeat protein